MRITVKRHWKIKSIYQAIRRQLEEGNEEKPNKHSRYWWSEERADSITRETEIVAGSNQKNGGGPNTKEIGDINNKIVKLELKIEHRFVEEIFGIGRNGRRIKEIRAHKQEHWENKQRKTDWISEEDGYPQQLNTFSTESV